MARRCNMGVLKNIPQKVLWWLIKTIVSGLIGLGMMIQAINNMKKKG